MLHAAAMLIGLFLLALCATQSWISPHELLLVGAFALVSVAVTMRLGGVGRNPFSYAFSFLTLAVARIGAVVRGTLSIMRASVAADVTLKPALVRVKTRGADAFASAAFADLISAVPGVVVVGADADGVLVHVMDEDAVDAADLGALEARVLASLHTRAQA